MIVLDASVVAKAYVPERGTDAAIELMTGGDRLAGPELVRLEVLSAITRRVRRGEATATEAKALCQRWLNHLGDGALALIPENDLLHDAIELSVKLKHALPDCLYLAAARRLDASLVTADRPFYERVKPSYKKVSMLPGCEVN